MDDLYSVEGMIRIPEENREEFNELVLMVLQRGGIRKTKRIRLAGMEHTIVSKPKPDEEGIVSFDYSVFEMKRYGQGYFNMMTGELTVSDCGYQEFGVVMNMIRALQVHFSCEPCNMLYMGKPMGIKEYLNVVATLELSACKDRSDADRTQEGPSVERECRMLYHQCGKDFNFPLYRVFKRRNEDEFLEWWSRDSLKLSDNLEKQLIRWKEKYDEMTVPEEMDVEQELSDILWELDDDWGCRYVDEDFVNEFLECRDEVHQKLLMLLHDHMEIKFVYFPELTRSQAVEWVLNRLWLLSGENVRVSAFVSLMTNHEKRAIVMGV